jgi:hypothetical protein
MWSSWTRADLTTLGGRVNRKLYLDIFEASRLSSVAGVASVAEVAALLRLTMD